MQNISALLHKIEIGAYDNALSYLYQEDELEHQRSRYCDLLRTYSQTFPQGAAPRLFSAPGRTEISGNHTDHQHGCVVAASINLDMIAAAAKNDCNCIRIQSEGFPFEEIDLSNLEVCEKEYNTTTALIRGVAAIMKQHKYQIGGVDLCVSSEVLRGSGLSSSAAFEILIATVLSYLYNNGRLDSVEAAQIGQLAENIYFGKPCGLMDQMACSVGGFVSIDFFDPAHPIVDNTAFDLASCGYRMYIVDVKGDHSDLTEEYAAVPAEMKSVAAYFGKEYLRQVPAEEFYHNLPALREKTSDRAVLRAHHFFRENLCAQEVSHALKQHNISRFMELIEESGRSSYMYLQNIYPSFSALSQPASVALMTAQHLLGHHGVCRIHGGGFGGTIQIFVEEQYSDRFAEEMETVTGKGSCHQLYIRPCGGTELTEEE